MSTTNLSYWLKIIDPEYVIKNFLNDRNYYMDYILYALPKNHKCFVPKAKVYFIKVVIKVWVLRMQPAKMTKKSSKHIIWNKNGKTILDVLRVNFDFFRMPNVTHTLTIEGWIVINDTITTTIMLSYHYYQLATFTHHYWLLQCLMSYKSSLIFIQEQTKFGHILFSLLLRGLWQVWLK